MNANFGIDIMKPPPLNIVCKMCGNQGVWGGVLNSPPLPPHVYTLTRETNVNCTTDITL